MQVSSKTIQKIRRYRDHGNATMTKDQRDYVKEEIEKKYIQGEIKETRQLKAKIIELANKYYIEKNKGKPVTELHKSTFYDFLRENKIDLPKRNKFKLENKSSEFVKLKLEEIVYSPKSVSTNDSVKLSESVIPEKPKMVTMETQTDDDNLFQYVVLFNQLVLVPLQQIKGGITLNIPTGNLIPVPK